MLAVVGLACATAGLFGDERPAGAGPERRPGHQRMIDALEAIRQASPERNVYIGDARARQLRRQVARAANLPAREQAGLRRQLAEAELWLGREREAIRQLERALSLLPAPAAADPPQALEIRYQLGISYLRLGATEASSGFSL